MSHATLLPDDEHNQGTVSSRSPSHFGYLVHDLARVRGALFDRLFKPIGLTRTQVVLLGTLVNFERLGNQQQLSIAMDLSKVTIGAMLHVLERNGLVMRGVSKKDRREKLIHVTPEGVAALDRAREIAREADKAILASLGTEGIMVTERVLRQTNEVIRDLMNNSAIKTEITSG